MRVLERELRESVEPHRLDHQLHLVLQLDRFPRLALHGDELAGDEEDRFQRSQTPVVVLLLREELLRQREQLHHLGPHDLGMLIPLRIQNHLPNQSVIRRRHSHGAEELLEVIREFGASAVAFPRGVEGHEDAGVGVDVDDRPEEVHLSALFLESCLDRLDLLRDRREHLGLEAVELVEAAPRAALDKSREDAAHRLVVDPFVAVEHQHLARQRLAERLDTLSLPSTSRPIGVPPVPQVQALREGQVALVRERGVDELRVVALVLVGVGVERVAHAYHAALVLHIVPQLLVPVPIRAMLHVVLLHLIHHVQVVDDVQDHSFQFQVHDGVRVLPVPRVLFELAREVALQGRHAVVAQRLFGLVAEGDLLCSAHDHRREGVEIEGRETFDERALERQDHFVGEEGQPVFDSLGDGHGIQ
mmetsp:Transcript_19355/g.46759  ORF Transcript_19355/g.46759 Transcript_19355/m.46759 type:complete len:417 (+) Transcript_19355:7106-8356(+)